MNLTAIIRMEKGGNVQHMTRDYFKNKTEFKNELKSNGIIVLSVYNEKDIETIKNMNGYELDTIQKQYVREIL